MRLFDQASPWQQGIRRVSVFKLYPQFPAEAPESDLRKLVTFLEAHHIKLALEIGTLTAGANCGLHVESYGGQYLIGEGRRIKAAGGTIDYLAMDEPLWFGRHYNGHSACHSSITEIADNAAHNLSQLWALFPNMVVGDIEPPPTSGEGSGWDVSELLNWIVAFRSSTQHQLAFLHLDMQWQRNWKAALLSLDERLAVNKIPLGIIYNGDPGDETDQAWADHTAEHYSALEKALGHPPAQIIFQSWHSVPKFALPESSSTSLTGIIRVYFSNYYEK